MMLPKSYTSPSESTSSGSIFRKLYSCPSHIQIVNGLNAMRNSWSTHCIRFHILGTPKVNNTWLNVVSDDAYMLVSIRTCVFMPEANHVAKFMYHNAKLITVLSYGDGLRTATSPPYVGATPARTPLFKPTSRSSSRTNADAACKYKGQHQFVSRTRNPMQTGKTKLNSGEIIFNLA